ncbi:MAG TPA: hypothetical protein VMH89_05635 [Candidatus Acidoferrum sp.]|nr:hypothetical protein [Candidatus Acidoferrum sp.]
MSRTCHFFSDPSIYAGFRVKVVDIVMSMVSLNRETLPFRRDFYIAGTRCSLSTNSQTVLQVASGWPQPPGQISQSVFEMEVVVDATMDNTPDRPAHFRGMSHLVFAVLPPRSFVAFDLSRKRIHAVLSNTAASDSAFWKTLFLPVTIGVLGSNIGIVPLHCACLERNGSGFLVAGVSGTGKSTLATALAAQGYAFISDDWTYISKQKSTLMAHGLSTNIKLLPDAARFFPELQEFTPHVSLNGEIAFEVDPARGMRFLVKDTSRPKHIFFLERNSASGCQVVPCTSEHVRSYFERSSERLPNELAEARVFRSSVIRSLSNYPSWIVRTGESPQKTAAAMEKFLLEATHAAS